MYVIIYLFTLIPIGTNPNRWSWIPHAATAFSIPASSATVVRGRSAKIPVAIPPLACCTRKRNAQPVGVAIYPPAICEKRAQCVGRSTTNAICPNIATVRPSSVRRIGSARILSSVTAARPIATRVVAALTTISVAHFGVRRPSHPSNATTRTSMACMLVVVASIG